MRFPAVYIPIFLGGFLMPAEPTKAQDSAIAEPAAPATEAAEEPQPYEVSLADGKLTAQMPGEWKQVKPRNNIIEAEFAVPNADDEKSPGRLTIMPSGGGVEGNIARWLAQFRGPEGAIPLEQAKLDEREVDAMPVHTVEIAGTYLDTPRGPFGPKVELPEHALLGAIIETKLFGDYFIKLTGPAKLVEAHREKFTEMLDSLDRAAK